MPGTYSGMLEGLSKKYARIFKDSMFSPGYWPDLQLV